MAEEEIPGIKGTIRLDVEIRDKETNMLYVSRVIWSCRCTNEHGTKEDIACL